MSGITVLWIRRLWCLVVPFGALWGCSSKESTNVDGQAMVDSAAFDSANPSSSDATFAPVDAAGAEMPTAAAYSAWRDCGDYDEAIPSTARRAECLCRGVNECDAVFGVNWLAMGSERVRVCGKANGACRVITFSETEGGATAKRCSIPLGTTICMAAPVKTQDLLSHCEPRFTCNLLQGTCPADPLRCD